MFDIGFSELLIIAVVALIVLGPERLPRAARFAGLWVRRARAQWYSVKSELERELAADELKQSLRDTEAAMRDIDDTVRTADARARREFEDMRGAAADMDVDDAPAEPAPTAMTPTDHRDEPGMDADPDAYPDDEPVDDSDSVDNPDAAASAGDTPGNAPDHAPHDSPDDDARHA